MDTSFLSPSVKVAFFDLDRTITGMDTDWLWAVWRIRRTARGWKELYTLMCLRGHYLRGRLTVESYMDFHRIRMRALTPSRYRSLAERFFNEVGRRTVFPEAVEFISFYKKRGIPVVLITAQNDIIASHFSDYLGLDHNIANRFTEENGRFTGQVVPYVFEEGKVHWAEIYCREKGVDLKESAFFSDSIHDAPLLSLVKQAVAVNPDSLLEKKAVRENWPVIRLGSAF